MLFRVGSRLLCSLGVQHGLIGIYWSWVVGVGIWSGGFLGGDGRVKTREDIEIASIIVGR